LIDVLDRSVRAGEVSEVTSRIAAGLQDLAREGEIRLSAAMTKPLTGTYARRLLHRCSATGYTAVVMTWGPGQQTQLHDHAGMWCVECVVEGELEVLQYDLVEQIDDRCRFRQRQAVRAKLGDAGSLIPPFEYHVLRNALADRRSVSLHVYAGEMDHCNLYLPGGDGWWDKSATTLGYNS
jgi:predicted metal-dependent enzyme (double-stranded beta helix superfamily)